VDTHIERCGAGQRMLFIHGSGCSSAIWHRQKEYLHASMQVVLIDLPGHGRSTGDGCSSVEEYGDAVYHSLKDQAPYSIAGHSLGGAIAMYLALSHPDIVSGIILIGTGAKLRVLPSILDGIVREKERTIEEINTLSFSRATSAATRAEVFGMMMGCPKEVTVKDFAACDRYDMMNSVGSIGLPTLILCGEDDAMTPARYSRFLKENIAHSKLVLIRDAGHMVMVEKPDEVNAAIEIFVKERL